MIHLFPSLSSLYQFPVFLLLNKTRINYILVFKRSVGMAAEAAISSAVELLGELLIQKVKFLGGVEGQVQLLKDELKRMHSFLKHANKKQTEDERVHNWISEMREVAQDAEDTIEMFLLNVENARNKGLLKRCTGFWRRMHHLFTIGKEIKSILGRLDAIDKSRERYGIKDLGEDTAWKSQVESQRRLPPWQVDEHLVGVDNDVRKMLRESILDEEKKGLSTVVIEGMGGIGKSTLARAIYNHPDVVSNRFDCRAWVVVSNDFTPHETIKQLIFQLPRSEEDKQKLRELEESTNDKLYLQEKLQGMLYKQLEGKQYFIVLDDVWEMEHWKSLTTSFPDQQGKTSRLLVTTRNKTIAKYGKYAHEMKLLNPEKSWELFLKKASVYKTYDKCPEELESIGAKILEKCEGLPLAISVIGGLLIETQTKIGWEDVLNQINSHLGRDNNSVSAILELSYLNLSPQLKSCFLCLAFFKEDATIPAKRLVQTWVEQGFIQQEGRRTVEEIARGYLDELINRNMLQIEGLTMDDRVKNCRLHDLLRDVCLRRAEKEIGFEIEGIPSESSHKPRHRVVHGENLGTYSKTGNKHLRSLLLINVYVCVNTPSPYWKSFQLLKILDIDGSNLLRFPHSFRALIGLKSLRIHRHSCEITPKMHAFGYRNATLKLPSWLDHLEKLEVLDMKNVFVKFPNVSLKMDRLRYFHGYCVRGPRKIENWGNVETLKYISQKDWLGCYSRLSASCHVRELGILLDSEKGSAELSKVRASLGKLVNLVKLNLLWNMTRSIETSFIPHLGNLTRLKLIGMIRTCPGASVFPPNLTHLKLVGSMLQEDLMVELGKLPKLTCLKLVEAYSCEKMRVLHDGFPCLKALSLNWIIRLRGMDIEEGGMPRLKRLQIHDCENLRGMNIEEGGMPNLKQLQIHNCPKLKTENIVIISTHS